MAANLGTAWIQVKPSMNGVRGSILSGLKGTGTNVGEQMGNEVGKSKGMTVGMAAVWGAASAVALKAIDTISTAVTRSIDGAIRRVDTLNNSSRTFANMGFDADKSAGAVQRLEESITGLPTPLDSAMRGMTALAATYSDVELGQKVFSSLNNAILGFGGTAEMVDNAIMQLSQLPMDGPLDAQTWNSLRNSGLTPVLVAMAKESGTSVSEMKKAFGEGELTVEDFTNRLMDMNTQGGGGLKSLESIAKDATKGIGTSLANANTAVVRGVATIIEALGSEKIAAAVTGTGKAMEAALKGVATVITELPKIIDSMVTSISNMVGFVKENAVAFGALAVAAGALAAPFAIAAAQALILDVRIRAMLLWDKVIKVVKGTALAFKALGVAMAANPIGLIIAAVAGLVAVFALLWKNNEGFRNFFISAWAQIQKTFGSVMSGIQTAWESFKGAIDTVTTAVSNFITTGLDVLNQKFQETMGWIEENKTLLTNIGIVIGTLLLPKIMQLGIQFVKMAAQAVVSAARASAAWVTSMVKIGAGMVKAGATAAVQSVKAGAAWVAQAARASFAWVTQTLPKIIAGFATAAAGAVKNAVIAGGAWVAQAAKTTVAWAGVFLKYLAGVAMAGVQTLIAGAKMAAGWLLALGPIGLIIAAVVGAVALIVANWEWVKNVVSGVWKWIQTAIGNVINWIKSNWPLLLAILTGPIGIAIGLIIKNFDKVKSFIGGVWSNIRSGASAAWNFIKGVFGGVAGWFRSIFQGAYNGVTGIWNRIKGFFSGIWGNIKSAFDGVRGLGKNIVEGLWNGINDMVGWVGGKIKGFGDNVLSGIKNFFGIKSPSRVMRDEVGKQITAGLGLGIERNTKKAVNAAVASSRAILGAFSTSTGFSTGLIPNAALVGAGGVGGGSTFYVTNPSPEETAEIIASRIKTEGGL